MVPGEALQREGTVREVASHVQRLRKAAGLEVGEAAIVYHAVDMDQAGDADATVSEEAKQLEATLVDEQELLQTWVRGDVGCMADKSDTADIIIRDTVDVRGVPLVLELARP